MLPKSQAVIAPLLLLSIFEIATATIIIILGFATVHLGIRFNYFRSFNYFPLSHRVPCALGYCRVPDSGNPD